MKRYKKIFPEHVDFPTKKWVDVELKELDSEQLQRLWDIYKHTYKEIGLSVTSMSELIHKYKISWLIDVDKDDDPDAFIIYKKTKFGNKLALGGSAGTPEVKKLLIQQMLAFVNKKGFYIETSHKVKDILSKNNAPYVDNERDVETILDKDIEWLGDGEYKRFLKGVGVVTKKMFGRPKI